MPKEDDQGTPSTPVQDLNEHGEIHTQEQNPDQNAFDIPQASGSTEEKTVAVSSDSSKRRYQYVNREKRTEEGQSILENKRRVALQKLKSSNLEQEKCCRKLKCFKAVDARYLTAQAELLSIASREGRREYLEKLLHQG